LAGLINDELRITIDSALYRYIKRYAEKAKLSPHSACLRVMSQTEKVLNLILKGEEINKEAFRKLAA
jgi:hypothetical protein